MCDRAETTENVGANSNNRDNFQKEREIRAKYTASSLSDKTGLAATGKVDR